MTVRLQQRFPIGDQSDRGTLFTKTAVDTDEKDRLGGSVAMAIIFFYLY